jgi:outer membrane protein assembly factor BamA
LVFHYENNESQISENTILDLFTNVFGVEKVNLIEGRILLDLDFRNDIYIPERGMRLYSEFDQGLITSNKNSLYTKYLGFLEIHSTIHSKFPVIFGLRGGGAWSTGDIPFYNMHNLGQNNFLRGYRKNRFIGESMIFFNSDLKIQLLDIATAFLPIKFGVRGFYDIGRVYVRDESSTKFHSGYGGGIFLVPLEQSFSLGLNMAFSEEENGLFIFELGIAF